MSQIRLKMATESLQFGRDFKSYLTHKKSISKSDFRFGTNYVALTGKVQNHLFDSFDVR